jgi:hypothetical protein
VGDVGGVAFDGVVEAGSLVAAGVVAVGVVGGVPLQAVTATAHVTQTSGARR